LNNLVEDSSGDRYTAKALEEAPSGTGSTPAAFVEALMAELVDTPLTFRDIVELISALASGGITRVGNVYTYKTQAGATRFTLTLNSDATERTVAVE